MLKRILSIVVILALILFTLQINVHAQSVPLGSVEVTLTQEKIAPGEEVTININFGTDLGAYTFDVAYDNSIFEYVRSEGGTENDNGTRVRVTYYDSAGGTNPRTNMSVTFRAKADLEATNPTNFSVTAEGLANADASQTYDDITSPIQKSITVEPNYVDYTLSLNYTGNVVKNEEKAMELITQSSMGRNYDHVKMQVEITKKPSDSATVKLLATERTRQEIDLVQDGWGEPSGYELGGKDASQVLDIRGLFSENGNYTIKISLLDMDSSNAVIVSRDFNVDVVETSNGNNNGGTTGEGENGTGNNGTTGENGNANDNTNNGTNGTQNNGENKNEEIPQTLPATGSTQYGYILSALAILVTSYIVVRNSKKEKK